ncbi:MAG TPA: hypothetical protein VKC61_24055 [Pyrinomonadaceae bacterium]|nr:hypothetical protein [Pyrinomonadaceae bacterium]
MKKKEVKVPVTEKLERQPYRVRLPGFVTDDDIGLGDLLKRVTYAVGIKPCGGCERRAAALNRRMVFSGKR